METAPEEKGTAKHVECMSNGKMTEGDSVVYNAHSILLIGKDALRNCKSSFTPEEKPV